MNSKQTLPGLKQPCYVKLKLSNEAKRQLLVNEKNCLLNHLSRC